ncbi:helix-turn-helix domain-containing protein [Streptomyces qinzhouensis]|uniref:Helix-turn-helix transcriptional regulator n=1 Tax=Streptomyces qinzhouensis TaxID=2599401 RepID=A0A5B8IJM9_9ACTN|nr:helix-turn-helix transcriptional regulator [Streptomyces qinzhouensis]QDY77609.1 helix-turn-helix transcriptional regulator [Streptomyces qinzhouensis]
MPAPRARDLGLRIAYQRSVRRPKLTQQQLADAAGIHVGTLRKIERGARYASDSVLMAIADALGIDVSELTERHDWTADRVRATLPSLSAAIATYDAPEDGPIRPLGELRGAVAQASRRRLNAQYVAISEDIDSLITELLRAFATATGRERADVARLLVSACRSADAVAFKFRAHDLSARLIELMRWVTACTEDPLMEAAVAYVRTETFFAAQAHSAGLKALERAMDQMPSPGSREAEAALGALHMRASVVAARAHSASAAYHHLAEARRLAQCLPEGTYNGTAFGPGSVRIHEVSVAVGLGGEHTTAALDVARRWKPDEELPKERRSGFFIELARAQLWSARADDAYDSLKSARHIAPLHTREHPWVRADISTIRRLKRAEADDLSRFAEWCHAGHD